MKVLIVDDIKDNLEMLEIILKSCNYSVKSALNGKIALEMLKSEKYDLIISDILMPVMDGFKFCKECKQDEELKNILFIFYTATYIDKKDEEFALSLGAQKFIRKPQEPDVLLSTIKEVIETSDTLLKTPIIKEEKEILKLYNERLISKLEKKNLDLEREVTAHKKTLEELIKAKEKAEESDRLKSSFLANLSHEVRTPMNAIIGFSDLLISGNVDYNKQIDYLKIINSSTYQLLNIVSDIVTMSKLEVQLEKANYSSFDLNRLMLDTLSVMQIEKDKKESIELIYENKADSISNMISSDETKLKQILENLIKNALKYTESGKVSFGYKLNDKNELEFFVSDTGLGIDNDKKEIIFERFRQADDSIAVKYGGNGLGLAIAKGYAELLGGKIWLINNSEISANEKGARFYFTIPYIPISKNENQQQENYNITETEHVNNLKVLIAEDDADSEMLITIAVTKYSREILKARTGIEAIEICRKNPDLDVILMDNKMPEMSGYEAAREIRKFNNKVVIIAQTAFALLGDKEKALQTGCNDYMSKPIKPELLVTILDKHLKK